MYVTHSLRTTAATFLLLATAAIGAERHSTPPYDVNKPVWFDGVVVQAYAQIPKPDGSVVPSPSRRDDKAYLVGNIFATSPFGPEIHIPNAPIVVPAHDDVFTRWTEARHPSDVYGFWVVPGPAALVADGDPQQNVRVRPMPAGSLAGAPLAYAIKYRGQWYVLTSGDIVELGLDRGLLVAVPSTPDGGFGGVGWLDEINEAKRIAE